MFSIPLSDAIDACTATQGEISSNLGTIGLDEEVEVTTNGVDNQALSNEKSCTQPRKFDRKEIYCPFTWNECSEHFDRIDWVDKLKDKLCRKDHNDWREFCYKILLGCIYSHKKEEEEAVKIYNSCEQLLEGNKNVIFFVEVMEGLHHVLSSCRLYLYIKMGNNEVARKIFSNIKSFGDLSKECQAVLLSVKAYILCEFGRKNEAYECAKLAIELDPDDFGIRRGAWYYLAGKIQTEKRHLEAHNSMPSPEERQLLERSIKINPFPVHFAVLADTYRETAKVLLQRSFRDNKPESDELCEKAKKMYEDTINDENATVNVLSRSGMGLIKLPKAFRNLELAKKAFNKTLEIHPGNPKALLGMGYLFEWHMNDYKEALKHFEQVSGLNQNGLHIMRMKYKVEKNYNPMKDCDKYIENLENMVRGREKLDLNISYLMAKAEYLLLIKRDLLAAVQEWKKAMELYPASKNILDYKCIFVDDRELNLHKVMLDEINQALKQKRFDKTDEQYLKEVLKKTSDTSLQVENKN